MIYAFFYSPEPEEPEVPVKAPTETTNVLSWRREVLKRAGYEGAQITSLAERFDIDLHKAVELVESGCPPERAVLILV